MNLRNTNEQKRVFSLVLFILAVLLVGLTSAELIKIYNLSSADAEMSPEALAQLIPEDEKVQQYLSKYQETAEELIGNNSFVPPPAGLEPPGDCTAIFGDEARIGDRWVSIGDRVGAAEVIEIGPTQVTLMLDDRRITRSPVLVAENNQRNSRDSSRDRESFSRNRGGRGRGSRGERPGLVSLESTPRIYGFDGEAEISFDLSEDIWEKSVILEHMSDGMKVQTFDTGFGEISVGMFGGSGDGAPGGFNVIRAAPDVIRR